MKSALVTLATLAVLGAGAEANPYGVCAHVSRDEFGARVETYDMMALAGLGYVRSDFDWYQCQRAKGGAWDFAKFDKTVDDAAARGVTVLPILYGIPKWAYPAYEHLDDFRDYIRAMVSHFGMKMPVVEIWNETSPASGRIRTPRTTSPSSRRPTRP